MAHKTKKRPAARKRSNESFMRRYGMTRSEWAQYKKESPQEAHILRMKVGNPACK